jgi:tripeptide aminopeptidase
MATASAQTAPARNGLTAETVSRDPRTARALEWLIKNLGWVNDEQVRITEIPAPPFHEAQRAAYLRKLLSCCGLRAHNDDVGNVVAERPGEQGGEVVLVTAHLDTVFPAGTPIKIHREGTRIYGPGIGDNGTGLVALAALARALGEAKIKTRRTIVFSADVGEEGEGNLRGIRKLVETYGSRLRYVIALDGASADHVITSALISRRIEIAVTGPGGHSWSDFGAPNPIHALSRGIARFVTVRVPEQPRTTFNIGEIEGGTSVNSIPFRAAIKVDLRSEAQSELDRLEATLREAIEAGVTEEMAAARDRGMASRGPNDKLEMKLRVLGIRPGGELPESSPLLAALREADRFLGNRSRPERSSTDANIPLSLGIDAISIGAGGHAGGAHSLGEWYDPTGRELGLQRALLTVLGVAGVEASPEKPSDK